MDARACCSAPTSTCHAGGDVKRDFAAMNEVYARRFPDPKPSRTTIGAELAIDILVEIEAVAMVDD